MHASPEAPASLAAGELVWPVVLETQQPSFRGLPYDSEAGQRCWRAPNADQRAAVLVGIVQLASGAVPLTLDEPHAALAGLAALAERTAAAGDLRLPPELEPTLLGAGRVPGWLAPIVERALGVELLASEEGPGERPMLHGGELLFPLVDAIVADPSWISWRSHPPEADALLKTPKGKAGAVRTGLAQLRADPGAYGIPAHRHTDVLRVLKGFGDKKKRLLNSAALTEEQAALLTTLEPGGD